MMIFEKFWQKSSFFVPWWYAFFKIADFLKIESFGQFLLNFMVFKVVEMQVMGRLVNNSFVPVIIVIEFKSALPHEQFLQLPILQARLPSVWDLEFLFFIKNIKTEVKKRLLSVEVNLPKKHGLIGRSKIWKIFGNQILSDRW